MTLSQRLHLLVEPHRVQIDFSVLDLMRLFQVCHFCVHYLFRYSCVYVQQFRLDFVLLDFLSQLLVLPQQLVDLLE